MTGQIQWIRWVAVVIAVGGLSLPLAAFSPAADSAVIVNSGSTNSAGFRIRVEHSGSAEYTETSPRPNSQPVTPARRIVPDALVQRLYSDLEAAQPLASLPRPRCMKSASFGTRLTIELGGPETPDLTCGDGDSPKLRALIRDANEIVALFHAK
jgi:hypothetical protein